MAANPERGVGNDPEPLGVAFLQGPSFTLMISLTCPKEWGILPCRFTVWPLGGGIRSRSNCLHDQKHFVPLCRVSLIGSLPTSENCTISVAPLCES